MLSLVGDVNERCAMEARRNFHHQVGSGQVYHSSEVWDHESHKVASPTSEVTSLESSFARIFQMTQQGQSQNVAENHSDVLQAANLHIRGRGDSGC